MLTVEDVHPLLLVVTVRQSLWHNHSLFFSPFLYPSQRSLRSWWKFVIEARWLQLLSVVLLRLTDPAHLASMEEFYKDAPGTKNQEPKVHRLKSHQQ